MPSTVCDSHGIGFCAETVFVENYERELSYYKDIIKLDASN